MVEKINCSDWALPMDNASDYQAIHFQFEHANIDIDPSALDYLAGFSITKLTLTLDDKSNATHAQALLEQLLNLKPSIDHFYMMGSEKKGIKMPNLMTALNRLKVLHGLLIKDTPFPSLDRPRADLGELEALSLLNTGMKQWPSWLAEAKNLMYLQVTNLCTIKKLDKQSRNVDRFEILLYILQRSTSETTCVNKNID
jgi:hypothetical protein